MFFTKNKKYLVGTVSIFLLFILTLPFFLNAEEVGPPTPSFLGGIVTCDGVIYKCDFKAFVGMINGIIDWIIGIAGVIFTISFIYGGFLYVTSGVKPGNKEKARSLLWNTLVGFVTILVSWLIVYTIIHVLVDSSQEGLILKFIK
jgi:hypothetical protein